MKTRFSLYILFLLFCNTLVAQTFTKLDIATGSSSATPRNFTLYNNQLYFSAFGNSVSGIGEELYVTNGTQAGTQLVSNINTSFGASSSPTNLKVFNGELYFIAYTNNNGKELYKTNGSAVTLVKDIAEGANDGLENTALIELNGHLYFFAQDTVGTGFDLWRSDGTSSGTVKMVNLNSNSVAGNKLYFTQYNNELYFLAQNINDITIGIELYKYNTTTNTVSLVVDIFPSNGQSSIIGYSYFTVFDGKLFFVADNKLRYTNGTTTSIVTNGATSLTAYFKPKVLNNQLIFIGNSTNNGSQDIYKCTFDNALNDYRISLVYNFVQTANLPLSASISNDGFAVFTELNNKLYVAAREATSPNSGVVFQIYETDGVTTRVAVPITYTGSPSARPLYFITANAGKLYYQSASNNSPEQLWEANPLTGNFLQLSNNTPQPNIPEQVFIRPMFVWNNELYFEGQKSGDGYELWKLSNNTLPAVCNLFTGTINNNKVVLQWQVSNQQNTKVFVVEKSINGVDFNTLANVAAAGNATTAINYTVSDVLPKEPWVYYRLKQVDKDGSWMYLCNVVTIKNTSAIKNFSVYPTVVSNVFTLQADESFVGRVFTIINTQGKIIHQQKLHSSNQQVTTGMWANGVYFIQLHNNGIVQTQKLIVQH